MMEELNSETMILLLSVLISKIVRFYNSTVCEDSAINIYHSPSVICHILYDFVFVDLPSIVCEDSARLFSMYIINFKYIIKMDNYDSFIFDVY